MFQPLLLVLLALFCNCGFSQTSNNDQTTFNSNVQGGVLVGSVNHGLIPSLLNTVSNLLCNLLGGQGYLINLHLTEAQLSELIQSLLQGQGLGSCHGCQGLISGDALGNLVEGLLYDLGLLHRQGLLGDLGELIQKLLQSLGLLRDQGLLTTVHITQCVNIINNLGIGGLQIGTGLVGTVSLSRQAGVGAGIIRGSQGLIPSLLNTVSNLLCNLLGGQGYLINLHLTEAQLSELIQSLLQGQGLGSCHGCQGLISGDALGNLVQGLLYDLGLFHRQGLLGDLGELIQNLLRSLGLLRDQGILTIGQINRCVGLLNGLGLGNLLDGLLGTLLGGQGLLGLRF